MPGTPASAPRPPGRVIDSDDEISALLGHVHRIAVLGIKPEPSKPAHYVPAYAQRAGYEIIPVPVYYPELTTLLGQPIYRVLADIPGPIDMVNVFRRSEHIPPHVPDIIAAHPRYVWMQLGIRNDAAARDLTAAGIDVVMDRCLLVEIDRSGAGRKKSPEE